MVVFFLPSPYYQYCFLSLQMKQLLQYKKQHWIRGEKEVQKLSFKKLWTWYRHSMLVKTLTREKREVFFHDWGINKLGRTTHMQHNGFTRTNHIYKPNMFSLGVWSAVQFENVASICLIGASSTVNHLELVPLSFSYAVRIHF